MIPFETATKGIVVHSRDDNNLGKTVGDRRCQLSGCRGLALAVRWEDDGQLTWPCTRGMDYRNGEWWIV